MSVVKTEKYNAEKSSSEGVLLKQESITLRKVVQKECC